MLDNSASPIAQKLTGFMVSNADAPVKDVLQVAPVGMEEENLGVQPMDEDEDEDYEAEDVMDRAAADDRFFDQIVKEVEEETRGAQNSLRN